LYVCIHVCIRRCHRPISNSLCDRVISTIVPADRRTPISIVSVLHAVQKRSAACDHYRKTIRSLIDSDFSSSRRTILVSLSVLPFGLRTLPFRHGRARDTDLREAQRTASNRWVFTLRYLWNAYRSIGDVELSNVSAVVSSPRTYLTVRTRRVLTIQIFHRTDNTQQ